MSTAQPTVVPSPAPGIDGWRQRLRDRGQLAGLGFGGSAPYAASQLSAVRHLAFLPAEALELDLDDPAQRQFGAYELRAKLGQGGMGVVYRAYQPALDREVAIKLLAAGPWASAEFIARFQREAQHAARLNHPNIVPIHEIGTHEELHFFSMALVRGQTLARRIADQGPLQPQAAAALLLTVAEALDYAHRLDVLHLDLKPGNVLLDERGVPMVADFGLARRLDQSLTTDSDEVSGTPSYMAPEQATLKSHKLSPATDVYGLGAILYEMLTGRPPFLGATPRETLQRVVSDEPEPLRQVVPTIPADLEAIAAKCLAKEPKDRYASARALAEDLARFRDDRPVSVRPLNALQRMTRAAKREPRITALAALFVLALLGGLVATAIQWRRAESGEARAEDSASHARTALWNERIETAWRDLPQRGALEIVPAMIDNLAEQEGAGATAEAERSRARIGALLASAPQLIDVFPGQGAVNAVAIAPDGSWVASARGTVVAIHEVSSGAERCKVDVAADGGDSWDSAVADLRAISDGSSMLAVPHYARNFPEPAPTSKGLGALVGTRDCAPLRPPADRFGRGAVADYSPDAGHAIVRRDMGADGELVRVHDWATLARVGSPPSESNYWWLAPGLAHIMVARNAWTRVEVLDPVTLAPIHRYAHGVPDKAGNTEWLRAAAWAHGGAALALAFMGGDVVLLDPVSGAATVLVPKADAEPWALAFSADDAWLAATYHDGSVRVWDAATRQTVGPAIRAEAGRIRAIPDAARRAVFVQSRRSVQLWSLAGDGTQPLLLWRRQDSPEFADLAPAAWNPGASLLATGSENGELRLWRAPDYSPAPGRAPPLALNEADPAFDGRHVASVEGSKVVVVDLDRGVAAGPAIEHPQAVAFALLATDPPRLVTSAGYRLHVHDWRTGEPEYAPIELADTPTVVALAPITQSVLVAYSGRNGERNVTLLESYVLATGARTGRVELDGLYDHFHISNDGRRVMPSLPGSVRMLDTSSLAEAWPALRYGPDALALMRAHFAGAGPLGPEPEVEGIGAALDSAAGTLWLRLGRSRQLLAVDARTGTVVRTWRVEAAVGSMRALSHGRVALILPNQEALRIVSIDGSMRDVALAGANPYAGMALSADGTRLAVALNRGAAVFDTDSGEWSSPALAASLAPGDQVSGLSLDRAGTSLLVRTVARNWQRFALPREDRPRTDLLRWRALLRSDGLATASAAIGDDARTQLRAADHGPVPRRDVAPIAAASARTAADADPRFVDLQPACVRWPDDPPARHWFALGRVMPPGRQRLLGIDFVVRCGVRTNWDPEFIRSPPIPVRMAHVAALEALITGGNVYLDRADVPYAILEFGYRDGSAARAPILYRRQIWESGHNTIHGGDARVAYHATAGRDSNARNSNPSLFAVRIVNPHPERELANLTLEAADRAFSFVLLLAVTLEPAPSKPTAPAGEAP